MLRLFSLLSFAVVSSAALGSGYIVPISPGQRGFGWALSTDGSTVVGEVESSQAVAFKWTADDGLSTLTGLYDSTSLGVSADGSIVVGTSTAQSGNPSLAFRWSSVDGYQTLPRLYSFASAWEADVSDDGQIIVGHNREAFKWTSSTGTVGLGYLPGSIWSFANAISRDKSTIVGTSGLTTNGTAEACRWTTNGIQGLGQLPSGYNSEARGVSADGKIIVGFGVNSTGRTEAFRWTSATGMVGFGSDTFFYSITANGKYIGGNGPNGAILWDQQHGTRYLMEALQEAGIDLTGWSSFAWVYGLKQVNGSLYITGAGSYGSTSRQSFLAVIHPKPTGGLKNAPPP